MMLSDDAEVTPAPAVLLVVDVVPVSRVNVDEVAVPVIFAVVLARLRMPAKETPTP